MGLSRPPCLMRDLLDVPSLAARLKVSVGHVRYLVRHQRIPYVRYGRRVRFEPRRIDAWLAANPHALNHHDNHDHDGGGGDVDAGVPTEERP